MKAWNEALWNRGTEMARVAEPVELAVLRGADQKNPQRYRDRKKAPMSKAGIGQVPDWLTGGAVVVWAEVEPLMAEGVLTVADRIAWASLCELEAERREGPRDFSGAKYSTLVSLLARFGMTPADRQKVQVMGGEDEPENPFSRYAS